MTLIKWNPDRRNIIDFRDEMDKLFDNFFTTDSNIESGVNFMPAVDIEETEKEYYVHAELPGMKKKDIGVNIKDNLLTISGEKITTKENKDHVSYSRERTFGKFERSFRLPDLVDCNKVEAEYKDGVIGIKIPKKEEAIAKNLSINIK